MLWAFGFWGGATAGATGTTERATVLEAHTPPLSWGHAGATAGATGTKERATVLEAHSHYLIP